MHNRTSTESPKKSKKQLQDAQTWWDGLSDVWKKAFNEAALTKVGSTDPLPEETLLTVYTSPNHRFAGPKAPYPNMSFELTELSGVIGLPNIQLLVATHQQLRHLEELRQIPKLRSLFVNNNEITSLSGIEEQVDLVDLYFQSNAVSSLLPLKKLTKLKALYCSNNLISSLEGIDRAHAECMEQLICSPNPNLKKNTISDFEFETRIRCNKFQ